MNTEEKEALKQEILAELEERFKGVAIREDVQGVLAEVRDKWFRDATGGNPYYGSTMYQLFGSITYWKVWETIRKLVCLICGCGYVRQLGYIKDREKVNRIAEILCQIVYDLRKDFMGDLEGER